ncbi:unnamed protein product [Sphagnum jensenii]|uniref:Laccase n=1 Tax=Sphagnum jensenii TaxID=128206 RepID=A0ABP1BIY1_9BRYO
MQITFKHNIPRLFVIAQVSICQDLAPSPTLEPFLDSLPIPPTIPVNPSQLVIGAYKITQQLHQDLNATTLYAYGTSQATAQYPGPTLIATQYETARIRWENHIPDAQHFLTVDPTIHWANPVNGGVPTVVHVHGAEVQSVYDGYPDAWFTPLNETGPAFVTQNYQYPNTQPSTMLWYHDHTDGITRLNVLAGLVGLYFVRSSFDAVMTALGFPSGQYEIPLVIRDMQFWPNGSINFPNIGDNATIHPSWCPEYFGDTILVNGKAWPYLTVYPRVYRFRILNGANARFFQLFFSVPNLSFWKIGTDQGYLWPPLQLSSILLAPAERVDVLVDFSSLTPGTIIYLNNSAPAPFPDGDPSFSPPQTNVVMQFHVNATSLINQLSLPRPMPLSQCLALITPSLSNFTPVTPTALIATVTRRLLLQEFHDANGNPTHSLLGNATWLYPVTETPKVGATEIWEMINTTPDAHPMHTHLVGFQVLNQQSYDSIGYLNGTCSIETPYGHSGSCFTDIPTGPADYQVGWKDTAIVWPNNVTRFVIRFTPQPGGIFPFDPTFGPGYVWHCHILDHEDNDMMRPFKLIH